MRIITLCAGLLLGAVLGASAQTPTAARGTARWQHLTHPNPASATGPAATQVRSVASVTRPGRAVQHGWDSTTNSWVKGVIETYAYDAQGRLTQETYADSATGVLEDRSLYTYDARGLNTEELYQNWDGAAWVNAGRYAATYDAQRNITEELHQVWTGTAWRTDAGSRYTLTYNPANILTEQLQLRWDNGIFTNHERVLYTLSASNQWTAIIQQLWDAGQWENETRFTNIVWHNWSKQQPTSFEEQSWQGQWETERRSTIVWAANDSYTFIEEEQTSSGTWQNTYRESLLYDAQGNETLDTSESWENNAWRLNYGYRSVLRYAATGELTRRLQQVFDRNRSTSYVNDILYTYSNFIILAKPAKNSLQAAVEVYPNPTTGPVTLRWATAARHADVVNGLGQMVRTMVLPAGATSQPLDLTGLPTGIYTIRLHTAEGLVVKRLVKE